jgi:hypothetical protein
MKENPRFNWLDRAAAPQCRSQLPWLLVESRNWQMESALAWASGVQHTQWLVLLCRRLHVGHTIAVFQPWVFLEGVVEHCQRPHIFLEEAMEFLPTS